MIVDDTIVAIATPPGRGALAVVRASGKQAHDIVRSILRPWPAAPRRATVAEVREPGRGAVVDRVVAIVYDGPRSYTGEDLVELSGHGGPLSPAALVGLLVERGARLAGPGEFTRRAVLNGKLDLLQAEATIDVVDAVSEAGRRAALRQLDGGLSRRIAHLRQALLELEALVAYQIDFPEEDDGPVAPERVSAALAAAEEDLANLLATAGIGEVLRSGAIVVIAGRPNVGKSSLLNALLGYRRAIVSETPGTTRDAIEVLVEGTLWPLRMVDTAGLREPGEAIEREGIEIAHEYLRGAHVALVCDDDGAQLMDTAAEIRAITTVPIVAALTKADLGSRAISSAAQPARATALVHVSAAQRTGLAALIAAIEDVLDAHVGRIIAPEATVLVRARHRRALEESARELSLFRDAWRTNQVPLAIAAVHLRAAVHSLETLIGAVDVEDVLDVVFSNFCIGK